MSALALSQITVSLGGARILDDVSLTVASGTVTAIIGPNGAGKSTLLAAAAGYLRPEAGTVHLGGVNLGRLSTRDAARRRAVMPQNADVAFPFTVQEVVAMGRTARGTSSHEDRQIVTDALVLTGLTAFAHREVPTLSGGERQLTALARVVAQATPVEPDSVVLLDEPTAAMDIAHAERTMHLTRTLAARGAAIVVVLHDLDAAAAYADRLVLMSQGRSHSTGTVREVCTERNLSRVYGTGIEVFEHGGRLRISPERIDAPAAAHGPALP